MSSPLPSSGLTSFVLFVAGEPESVPGVRAVGAEAGRAGSRWAAWFLPVGMLPKELQPAYAPGHRTIDNFEHPPLTDHRPWHLPPQQFFCVDVVRRAAERDRRPVLVVDVNQPGDFQDLVDRWVRPNDVMPVLVRPDGARFEGEENFVPSKVRRFMAGR